MIEVAFWLAMAVACFGALSRDRASIALLASAAVCVAADEFGVEFWRFAWVLIDFAVITAIVRPAMPKKDWIVLLSFIPAWALYFAPDPHRYNWVMGIVIFQMLTAFPVRRFVERLKKARYASAMDYFDLRVRHVGT